MCVDPIVWSVMCFLSGMSVLIFVVAIFKAVVH